MTLRSKWNLTAVVVLQLVVAFGGAAVDDRLQAADHAASTAASESVATVEDGDDWSLPSWVSPSTNSGFFSELPSPAFAVGVRSVDLSWRQLNPAPGVYSTTSPGSAQGMSLPSYDQQLAGDDPVWVRIFASGTDWAPEWVAEECDVSAIGVDYDDQAHLPIWDPCVWGHLRELYRTVFLDWGLRSDPRLRFVYVPGAFTWCEFDFDMVSSAVDEHGLTYDEFAAWFEQATADLVVIFDGDNDDPADDAASKLVYTGEDYPFGPWDELDDGFARDAVVAGMGIRTGITELFNFHLNHIPAWGTTIAADGHMVTDESWPLLTPTRIRAAENECFNDCGYSTSDPYYAVKMANLKALQMRVNWLYVVPETSYMVEYPELWRFVRLSLGKTAATSADAWAALREAEDRYWLEDESHQWNGRPWVRNLERWLVQRDATPDGVSRRGTDVRSQQVDPDNGTAYEGRRTDLANGQRYLYFDLDDAFLHRARVPVALKVTYLDAGSGSWRVEYDGNAGLLRTAAVTCQGTGRWRTATFVLSDALFAGGLPAGCDFRLASEGPADLEVRFVRVVKLTSQPAPRRPRGRFP